MWSGTDCAVVRCGIQWLNVFLFIRGPEDSLYKGGMYHGKLVFPSGEK